MHLTSPSSNGGGVVPYTTKIGELLIQEKLLTSAQLQHALAIQKEHPAPQPLGEVCVELGFLSRADFGKLFRKAQNQLHLGELLRDLGLVSQEQVAQALAQQKAEGKQLGAILIEKGALTETALINVLSKYLGVSKLTPSSQLIDKSLLQGLSEGFLRKNMVLPVSKQNGILTLLMANPFNDPLLRELEKVFGCPIEPAVAAAAEIQNGITQCFLTTDIQLGNPMREAQKSLIIGQTNLAARQQDAIIEFANTIISQAILEGASDIHIEPQERHLRVRYRIDGVLVHRHDLPLSIASNLISRIKVLCRLDITERRRHQDGRIEARIMEQEVDLRVATYVTVYGESVTIRILQRQTPFIALDALGFSPFNRSKYQ
jgi:type IV pilus assembly protein PilB